MSSERRHIVHVVGTLQAGGVQRLILNLTTSVALSLSRHSVLCLFGDEGELAGTFREAGITTTTCRVPWPDSLPIPSYRISRWLRHKLAWTFPRRMASALRSMDADIVHTHITTHIDKQATAVLHLAGLPLVWTIHGLYRPEGAELKRWRRAVRSIEGGRGQITAVSRALVEDFVRRQLGPSERVRVIHGGIDLARFRAGVTADTSWRSRWDIPVGAILFGCSGRFVREKAYDVLISAADLVVRNNPDAHFLIAGSGPLLDELQAEVVKRGLRHHIHFLGFQDDIPAFLSQLDVFVLPSRSEALPLALIEALGSGLPCIATRVGGVPEVLGTDGGLIVAPESSTELANAMRLMISPETRAIYSAKGPAIAKQFSVEVCARNCSQIYDTLLRKP